MLCIQECKLGLAVATFICRQSGVTVWSQVIRAPRGRGTQLNAGWRASKADWVRCSTSSLP
jgi:hypothetical protein